MGIADDPMKSMIMSRRAIGWIIAGLFVIFIKSESFAQQNYQDAVERMLEKYPQSTLQDIYKSFFQDCFGPGHLISDTTAAREYLHRELMGMGETAMPYYEPAGDGKNYYRVSLAVIKDGIVTEEAFFDAFIESAGKVTFPAIEKWTEKWAEILEVIPANIENYPRDKAMIDSVLAEGKYAVHHSRRFNEVYHPHYRLIDKVTFENKLLPLITTYLRR